MKACCYPKCYPNLYFVRPAHSGASPSLVKPDCRVALHCLGDVRVKIDGGRDAGVPKSLLGDFRMHAGEQKLRRMAVAQIMEAHPRQVRDPRYSRVNW